ncbi:3948_t:CDS:10 [Entrophospora sp. SA101]|nr:3948_t:CDS:10 [Entrophospora sp. SA101]
MAEEQKIELTETSNAEEIEATSLKYEEKLKKEREEKKVNLNAYLKEKQKRIDVEEENNRLKEKLEKKTMEGLREKELDRKTQREQNNLLNVLFVLENKVVYDRTFKMLETNEDREDFKREVNVIPFRLGRIMDTVEYEITNEERFEEALESETACKEFTQTLIEQTAENIDLRLEDKIPQLISMLQELFNGSSILKKKSNQFNKGYPQDPDDKSSDYTPMETKIRSYKKMICLIDSKAKNTIDIGGYKDNVNFPALDLEKRFGAENVLEDNLPNNYGMLVFDERCLQLYKRGKQKGFRHKEEAENGNQWLFLNPVIHGGFITAFNAMAWKRKLQEQVQELNKKLSPIKLENKELKDKLKKQGQKSQALQPLLEKKIADLESQLLNLAKQKIKGKKEAEELEAEISVLRVQEKDKQINNFERGENRESQRITNTKVDTGYIGVEKDKDGNIVMGEDENSKETDHGIIDKTIYTQEQPILIQQLARIIPSYSLVEKIYNEQEQPVMPTWYLERLYRYKKRIGKKTNKDETDQARLELSLQTAEHFRKQGVRLPQIFYVLLGKPGVGKSEISQRLAQALKRPIQIINVGGMDDGGELEGKRATLQSANYGKMMEAFVERSFLAEITIEDLEREIQEIKTRKETINQGTDNQKRIKEGKEPRKTKKKAYRSRSPVILLDEFEKASREDILNVIGKITDRELNYTFLDKYFNFNLDISQAVILLTANYLEKVPQFVQDRGEPVNIELLSYAQRKRILEIISTIYCRTYGIAHLRNKISDKFLEMCITETWGIRGGMNNLQKVMLFLVGLEVKETSEEDYKKKESGVIKLTYFIKGEARHLTLTKRIGIEKRTIKDPDDPLGEKEKVIKEIITGTDIETDKPFVED